MASNERAIVNNLNERARFFGGPDAPQLTIYDVRAVLQFFDRKSCKSGEPATSLDHVNPLSLGGENIVENLQVLTKNENKAKGDKEIDYRKGNICTPDFVAEYMREYETSTTPTKEAYKKHDWDEIEWEFVSSDATIRELAKKHSVSLSHIGMVSSRENWLKKRENYRNKLGTKALEDALEEGIDLRLEISRTTLDFLKLWRRQANRIGNQDLIKLLELGARASGLELDKRSVTLKDWRDVGDLVGNVDDIQQFASAAASDYFEGDTGSDTDPGA